MPVLFSPRAAVSTLIAPLLMGMNGRTVLQGASPLAEKRGQAVLEWGVRGAGYLGAIGLAGAAAVGSDADAADLQAGLAQRGV